MQFSNNLIHIKRYGNICVILAIIIEIYIWPSIENLMGCGMTWICWHIFSRIGLNQTIIQEHIFSWLVFLSMSLYRILPLFATMIEGHSIGYNFVVPIDTYTGETVLYLFSALAFYLAIKHQRPLNGLKRLLFKYQFYTSTSNKIIWALGIIGLIIRLYLLNANTQFGDIIGKTLSGFTFFQYAPIILFFPTLYQWKQNQSQYRILIFNRKACFYLLFIIILAFATNSRYAIIEPFGTFALLFLLSYLQSPIKLRKTIHKKHILLGGIAIIFIIPFMSDVSLAMIANRGTRDYISKTELFHNTISTYLDDEKMESLRKQESQHDLETNNLSNKEWSETYVNNFALNRYCNLKVTDNTLYHAQKIGFANNLMYYDFWNEIIALLPTPILKLLNINYNKSLRFSRGDKLKSLSTGTALFSSYLVTSHLADGLVTFGYFYFPIEFLLFYLRFLFLDTFLIKNKNKIHYSLFGLITIFSFLAMFRNAGGCCDSLAYILRGYWQDIILYMIGFLFLKKIFQ